MNTPGKHTLFIIFSGSYFISCGSVSLAGSCQNTMGGNPISYKSAEDWTCIVEKGMNLCGK